MAASCAYPKNYFDELGSLSDEDLEIERNDVRDVLRSVTGSGEGGSTSAAVSTHGPLGLTSRILSRVLDSCNTVIMAANTTGDFSIETAVHAFSSLAKPLNFIAKCSVQSSGNEEAGRILDVATSLLGHICKLSIEAFHQNLHVKQVLPISRITEIAIASLAPMLSAIYQKGSQHPGLLSLIIEASVLSLERLPEVYASSTRQTLYDVRGSMRGPAGEDHVGCLALMRMAREGNELTQAMSVAIAPSISRICSLYQTLKMIENERGFGIIHDRGVAPVSRRILLRVLCDLELASQGQIGASPLLKDLFESAVVTVASFKAKASFDEKSMGCLAECAFDLSYFAPPIVSMLFISDQLGSDDTGTACVEALTNAVLAGYHHMVSTNEAIIQVRKRSVAQFLQMTRGFSL